MMNQKEIEREAHKLEGVTGGKSVDGLADELHKMDPKDRIAVAKQVLMDQQSKSSVDLPTLSFYDSGDVRAVDTKSGKMQSHYEFDKSSGKRTKDDVQLEDSHEVRRYDAVTHKMTNDSITWKNGDNYTGVYDSATGNVVSEDRARFHGKQVQHTEYDSKTGNRLVVDEQSLDHTKRHIEYNQQGRKNEEKDTDKDGNTVEVIWDPGTHNIIMRDQSNIDGSGDYRTMDRNTGWVNSIRHKDKNGQITKWDAPKS